MSPAARIARRAGGITMRRWDCGDAIEAVWRSELPSTTRLLALAMCWEANEAGVVMASQLDLAMMMHATDRAVRTHLKALVRAGTITELARTTSTWWRIEWGALDANTSEPDPTSAPPFPLSPGRWGCTD